MKTNLLIQSCHTKTCISFLEVMFSTHLSDINTIINHVELSPISGSQNEIVEVSYNQDEYLIEVFITVLMKYDKKQRLELNL